MGRFSFRIFWHSISVKRLSVLLSASVVICTSAQSEWDSFKFPRFLILGMLRQVRFWISRSFFPDFDFNICVTSRPFPENACMLRRTFNPGSSSSSSSNNRKEGKKAWEPNGQAKRGERGSQPGISWTNFFRQKEKEVLSLEFRGLDVSEPSCPGWEQVSSNSSCCYGQMKIHWRTQWQKCVPNRLDHFELQIFTTMVAQGCR